jgi:hypothetical protein
LEGYTAVLDRPLSFKSLATKVRSFPDTVMSAKRIKTEHVRKERGKQHHLPIPSFAGSPPPRSITAAADSPTEEEVSVKATWNGDHVMLLDLFLSHQFKKNRPVMTLRDACAVAGKALAQIRSNAAARDGTHGRTISTPPAAEYLEPLQEEERLLYHLLTASSSSNLYELRERNSDGGDVGAASTWCLEKLPFSGNPREELRTLLDRKHIGKVESDCVLEAFRRHRESTAGGREGQPKKRKHAEMSISRPTAAFARGGSTVEERVRARAQANQKRSKGLEAPPPAGGDCGEGNGGMDRERLVRLADALWTYSHRHVQQQQQQQRRFRSPAGRKGKPRFCILTMKDAVTTLRDSSSIGKTSGMNYEVVNREKLSKRQVAAAILELRRRFPEWITLSGDVDELSPETTIFIKPVEYNPIRSRLAAGRLEGVAHAPPKEQRPSSSDVTPQPSFADSLLLPTTKSSRQTEYATPFEGTTQLRVVTAETTPPDSRTGCTEEEEEEQPRAKKKARLCEVIPSRLGGDSSVGGEPGASPTDPQTRRRDRLRINENLILSPADHVGGEVLERSCWESPRALKSLFYQLNAGERI